MTEEEKRLKNPNLWRKWGPYLSERQWGTVREDYSANGDAWNYVTHDQARSYVYRWGEDGISGICDEKQFLCFAPTFWNGKDPILKERLFGLTGKEGNHGEDVKELSFYLENVPSHAYMKALYKYPQNAFPYDDLVKENQRRTREEMEYELLDTNIFDEDRYFDIFLEYVKSSPNDIIIKITVENCGPDHTTLHLLPTIWFRNTWSWGGPQQKPKLALKDGVIWITHQTLGAYYLFCDQDSDCLFTDNEIGKKDAFHRFVIHNENVLNQNLKGTKAAYHCVLQIPPKQSKVIQLRLTSEFLSDPFGKVETIFTKRKNEAKEFYDHVFSSPLPEDMKNIQRQAFAGLLWNKQCYHYNVRKWLGGDPGQPLPPEERKEGRNAAWRHFDAFDIFSMPDKWEYPWFAAWDLAFHTVVLALIDPDFSKEQLLLLTREWFMHPNGQLPAYEWEFSDVNPPVHAWAALRIYKIEARVKGFADRNFLERIFQKLLLNFTWWVNRKDQEGRNIFEGGFLGLDNIGVFDRSKGIPSGGILEQPDGTGWMAMYCLNLLEIALELAIEDPVYEDMATKFFEHFVSIAAAINNVEGRAAGLWDHETGQYSGHLRLPDGKLMKLHAETIVGFIPLLAVAASHLTQGTYVDYRNRFDWYVQNRPDRLQNVGDFSKLKTEGNILLSLANPERLKIMLQKLLDENCFLSPFGLRSVSRLYLGKPYVVEIDGKKFQLDYEPAESTTPLFGGNSNWRGPIWFPLNFLFIEALQKYHFFLGDEFLVEYPTGSGKMATLWEISSDLTYRLIKIFLKDKEGKRPLYGGITKFQTDPRFQNYILFHEYFHGDNGAGLGASNQTGWTALVAKLIEQYGIYEIDKKPIILIDKTK